MKRYLFAIVAMMVVFVAAGTGKASAVDKFYGYVGGKATTVTFTSPNFFDSTEGVTYDAEGTIKITGSKAVYTLKGTVKDSNYSITIYDGNGAEIGVWEGYFGFAAHQAYLEGELIKSNGSSSALSFTDQAGRNYWVDYKNPAW